MEIKTNSLIRFFLLGAISTAIDYAVFSALIVFDIYYLGAVAIGYSAGFIFNFIFGRTVVFTNGAKTDSIKHEFFIVSLITLFGLMLSLALMYFFSEICCMLDPFIARAITIIVVFFYNYIARKIFVYH